MVAKPSIYHEKLSLNPSKSVAMLPLLSQDWQLKGNGECNVQIALVGTVGMKVTLRQRGRKDYVLLYTERMVCISFVINSFKKNFYVVNVYKMFLCIFFYLLISKFWGFSLLALVLRMQSVLVFRSTK